MAVSIWGSSGWGTGPWGIGAGPAPPVIIPVYPLPGTSNVPPNAYLQFFCADADTDIDLANTTVTLEYESSPGTWVPTTVYTAGAFVGGWAVESTTAPYAGVYGNGYNFSCRYGPNTWIPGLNYRVTVDTQDLDAPPSTATRTWGWTSVAGLTILTLEQLNKRLLLATFSTQIADETVAPQNILPTALRVHSWTDYQHILDTGEPSTKFTVQIQKITRGPFLYPNQLMLHTTEMTEGEYYFITSGSLDFVDYVNSGGSWAPGATDLVDVYGMTMVTWDSDEPLPLQIQKMKTDQVIDRFRFANYDVSLTSNLSGLIGAISLEDDRAGGSGKNRWVTRANPIGLGSGLVPWFWVFPPPTSITSAMCSLAKIVNVGLCGGLGIPDVPPSAADWVAPPPSTEWMMVNRLAYKVNAGLCGGLGIPTYACDPADWAVSQPIDNYDALSRIAYMVNVGLCGGLGVP